MGIYYQRTTKDGEEDPELLKLREYCLSRGWKLEALYSDPPQRKLGEDRPGLNALLSLAVRKGVDVFLVAGFSRIGSSVCAVLWFLEEIGGAEVDFVSLEEGFDTTHPKTNLIYSALVTLAKMETEMFLECVRVGRGGDGED